MDNLDKVLEGILFLSGDGIDKGQIMEKLQITPKQLDKAIETLKKKYDENCGINFITYKDKLQLCGNPKFADDVSVVLNPIRERSLTRATLEVMAIIAYKQPVTRIDVQDIRGMNSDYALQTLLNYKLIEVVGRKDAVGKPLLFGTTDLFLRHFGIDDLNQLPDYEEIMKDIEQIEKTNTLYNEFDIPADEEQSNNQQNENNTQRDKVSNDLNADTKDNASAKASEITNKIETTIQENNIDNNQNDKNSEVVENIKSKTENEIIDFKQSNNFSDNTDKTEEDNSHIEGIDYSLLEDWS